MIDSVELLEEQGNPGILDQEITDRFESVGRVLGVISNLKDTGKVLLLRIRQIVQLGEDTGVQEGRRILERYPNGATFELAVNLDDCQAKCCCIAGGLDLTNLVESCFLEFIFSNTFKVGTIVLQIDGVDLISHATMEDKLEVLH